MHFCNIAHKASTLDWFGDRRPPKRSPRAKSQKVRSVGLEAEMLVLKTPTFRRTRSLCEGYDFTGTFFENIMWALVSFGIIFCWDA